MYKLNSMTRRFASSNNHFLLFRVRTKRMASQTKELDIQKHPTTKRSEATDDQPQLELEVPVIDLAGEMDAVVEEVKNACKGWGFFQVINHGVPVHLVQGIHECSKEFFGMPEEDKKKVKRDELNPMGYHDTEHTKNVRDWKEIFDFLVEEPNFVPASPDFDSDELRTIGNQWPTSPSQFRVVCEEYGGEMEKLALKLIQIISLSLGLPADRLIRYFEKQLSFVRINHYPPCPFPDFTTLGCGRHKDPEVLTILAQDSVGGLEVKTMSNGQWVPVEPILGAFIINVGDICQVCVFGDFYMHVVITSI
ncbi:Naringenin,2-oxoglutarate 3-dioxygenase [Linum grandiflorum]